MKTKTFIVSGEFEKNLNSLNVEDTVLGSRHSFYSYCLKVTPLSHCNVIAGRDKILNIDEVRELRQYIAESLIDSSNVAVGLWSKNFEIVFSVLKTCDAALYDDGNADLIANY